MQRRWILAGLLFVAVMIVVSWVGARNRRTPVIVPPHITRVERGAVFVCVNNRGDYSPGVYLNDPEGGEPSLLEIVQQAAPYMRGPEPGDAAAGLCGYLFKQLGNDTAASASISLFETPRPLPGGNIDWQSYCGRQRRCGAHQRRAAAKPKFTPRVVARTLEKSDCEQRRNSLWEVIVWRASSGRGA